MRKNPAANDDRGRATRYAGLAADDRGVEDGRAPLVLLHGLTFNRAMWRPATEELRRIDADRRVVALDLPGHGDSPAWPSYDTEAEAAAIHDAVIDAGLDTPIMVGHSAAGITATVYAASYPSRGVINVDAAPEPGVPMVRQLQSLADRMGPESFPEVWQMFEQSMHLELLSPDAQQLLRDNSTPDRDLIVGHWQELFNHSVEEIEGWLQDAMAVLRDSGVHYSLVLGAEPGPALVPAMRELLPGIDVTVWPGTGHFPHVARARQFARLLETTARWSRATSGGYRRIA